MDILKSLSEQSIILEGKDNIISIKSNQPNHCCLYSLESKDLVCIKYLLSPFLYAIMSIYTKTQKC